MLKFLVLVACVGAVLSMPKRGLEYEKTEFDAEKPFGMTLQQLENNPFAQKLFSIKQMLPWLSVRTAGLYNDSDKNVVSYTRASGEWLGLELFGDFLYDKNNQADRLGFGGGFGDLAKIYYNMDVKKDNGYDLVWDAGI